MVPTFENRSEKKRVSTRLVTLYGSNAVLVMVPVTQSALWRSFAWESSPNGDLHFFAENSNRENY